MTLSQYFVVGEEGSNHPNTTERWTNYYDILRNAFVMIFWMKWSPHMGYYLYYMIKNNPIMVRREILLAVNAVIYYRPSELNSGF